MLNVLCFKTLEQARMEVLEENEFSIMRDQQRSYEEIRNAELAEAQRFEAHELRKKQEAERRKNQQKSRKKEKEETHKKITCRQIAKRYLGNLRPNTLKLLKDQGALREQLYVNLHENVMPWLLDKMKDFLVDDQYIQGNLSEVVLDGYNFSQKIHSKTIQDEKDRVQADNEEKERVRLEKEEVKRQKVEAKLAAQRAEELKQLKEEIKKSFVDKGESRDNMNLTDLHDSHGSMSLSPVMGAVGG